MANWYDVEGRFQRLQTAMPSPKDASSPVPVGGERSLTVLLRTANPV